MSEGFFAASGDAAEARIRHFLPASTWWTASRYSPQDLRPILLWRSGTSQSSGRSTNPRGGRGRSSGSCPPRRSPGTYTASPSGRSWVPAGRASPSTPCSKGWNGYERRIDTEMLEEVGPPPGDRPLIFVCGPTPLVKLGYDPTRVKTERFGPTGG